MTETSKVTTAPARPKFLRKGEQTRAAILDVA
ncbi:MAG: TetR/AcrR family transcriptional regulator, partial [Herbaspirillum sp.]|nr:TetR/AcrR family transcriptional regulator [Herbaspirillum sp.]